MRLTFLVLCVLFALSVPVLLITTNVRFVANSVPFYEYGMRKYGAAEATNLPFDQVLKGGNAIITYFNDNTERLDVTVVDGNGVQQPLFNEREIIHMVDVKKLIQMVYTAQAVAIGLAVALAAYALIALSRGHMWAAKQAGWAMTVGGGVTAVLVALVGGLAAGGGFEALFTQFHLLSFSNDFWLLDPRTDHLIQMFSGGFFFEATILVAVATLLQGVALATLGFVVRAYGVRLARNHAVRLNG